MIDTSTPIPIKRLLCEVRTVSNVTTGVVPLWTDAEVVSGVILSRIVVDAASDTGYEVVPP